MPIILRLLAMGVPAAKIIAKHGKKAYKAAKKSYDKLLKKAEKSKLAKKLNEPIFKKTLKKDIKVRGKTIVRNGQRVPKSTPINPNKVTWREWKDASRRDFLETTPAHLITMAAAPPAMIGVSVGAAELAEKILGKKDKKKRKKLEKKTGGKIKTYAKGSVVRKPRSY